MKNLISENGIVLENNTLYLKGPLIKETVMSMWDECKRLIPNGSSLIVDLNQVTHCDSSSFALMLELMRMAKRKKFAISFSKMPLQMLEIAKVNGLSAFLPISEV